VPQAFINMHVDALKAAVARIETEFAGADAPPRAAASKPAPARAVRPVAAESEPPRREIGSLPASGGRIALIAAMILAAFLVAGLGLYVLMAPERSSPVSQARSTEPERPVAQAPPAAKRAAGAQDASYILRPQRVFYRTTQPVGSVIVSRGQRFLYVVQPNNVAIRYAIALGAECESLAGLFRVTEKINQEPPAADAKAKPAGAFDPPALYFGGTHALHKAREPASIGQFVKSGCFQAVDQDIADLYERVPLDERVVVAN
jgi:lipoprotein-anchoring transpeptidase ErfK/SrfK